MLAVLPDRKKKTVLNFLRSIPKGLKKSIHSVCTDMWPHYIAAVKKEPIPATVHQPLQAAHLRDDHRFPLGQPAAYQEEGVATGAQPQR